MAKDSDSQLAEILGQVVEVLRAVQKVQKGLDE